MTDTMCGYCQHSLTAHHSDLAVDGGLFQPGTRPCVAIVMITIPAGSIPGLWTSQERAAWWPCSCNDYRDEFAETEVEGEQPV